MSGEEALPDDSDNDAGDPSPAIGSADIGKILQSDGPVVTCVVLKAPTNRAIVEDRKVEADEKAARPVKDSETDEGARSSGDPPEVALDIDEIKVDTTPQKNEVEKVLGGPFTFIGQYEDEGIVLMARRGLVEEKEADNDNNGDTASDQGPDFANMSIKELRAQCASWNVNTENVIEKPELIDALKQKELELPLINPHHLRPPLHHVRVRGDILILRVAEVDEPLDANEEAGTDENDTNENVCRVEASESGTDGETDKYDARASRDPAGASDSDDEISLPTTGVHLKVPSNDEFFLSYTKDEYLRFLAAPICNSYDDENDDGSEELEGDNDGELQMAAAAMEEMTEEEEKSAMLNIVMAELLRKFREENERGANSREVLEIRASVAEQLGMEVTVYDGEEVGEVEAGDRKRPAESSENEEPQRKRVKFDSSVGAECPSEEEEKLDSGEGSQSGAEGVARLPQKLKPDGSED